MRSVLLLAVVAGCATTPRASDPLPDVRAHGYEVLRIPNPAYIPDGVQITRLDGESAWARAASSSTMSSSP